jgi:2-methylcitrate dehydratase PrpD
VALRQKVKPQTDKSVRADAMAITIKTKDGRSLEKYVQKALGSQENPISDAQMDEKARDLCKPILGAEGTEKLIETCRSAFALENAVDITAASTPG